MGWKFVAMCCEFKVCVCACVCVLGDLSTPGVSCIV